MATKPAADSQTPSGRTPTQSTGETPSQYQETSIPSKPAFNLHLAQKNIDVEKINSKQLLLAVKDEEEKRKVKELKEYRAKLQASKPTTISPKLREWRKAQERKEAKSSQPPSTTFSRRDFKEYQNYIVALKTHFKTYPRIYQDPTEKVICAVQGLRGDAQKS